MELEGNHGQSRGKDSTERLFAHFDSLFVRPAASLASRKARKRAVLARRDGSGRKLTQETLSNADGAEPM
jgi:hypothetical protein